MSLFQLRIATEYPILFLSDSESRSAPRSDGRTFALANADSVCFFVLSYVDGASLVTVSDEEDAANGAKMFSGVIEAASGVLVLSDSDGFRYLNVPVPHGSVTLEIWAEHKTNPDWVLIKLAAIRAY